MTSNNSWEEIKITDIDGVRIGNAQDYEGMTGVTVVIFDKPCSGGIDISGGGPASRETHLLSPLANESDMLNAIVLSGGSAYGLAASTGVMQYLQEHKMGYYTSGSFVPLVCQSCIFDLSIGKPAIFPSAEMGYKACQDSEKNNPISGIIGAGTGAVVGKVGDISQGEKSGIGYYAVQIGDLKMAAIAVVNALGDIHDYKTGQKVAGMMNKERTHYISAESEVYTSPLSLNTRQNTTLGIIITNADFSQADMSKVASMARAAFGRCIYPVGTMADGDTIYAVSIGKDLKADISMVGALAASVLSEAICDAVRCSHMSEQEFLSKVKNRNN
ncbi:P1 family peptidase [Scatolibacter rhodanostii]|uniref:P1 family peptidase n=1 Tax=Scatolibacter rhodanostii TaxID=2014781 RepID=UPI000C073715|nr:P1 family peptidase [Scatolibacter rhodanostii]